MAIPYALKVLENPMRDITARYSMLCQSLGIEGLVAPESGRAARPEAPAGAGAGFCLRAVDWRFRRGRACSVTMDFRTLPFYLYQQIGSYRSQDGAVTALIAADPVLYAVYRY